MARLLTTSSYFSTPDQRLRAVLILVLLSGTLARFYHIDAPMLDHHSWRQYDTAAVARNFARNGMHILYPEVDWRGNSPGFVQSEFPVYSYLVAALYRVFGVHEWFGRALNLLVYLASALLLFRMGERLFNALVAILAVFFYSVVPLSLYFTRTFQPDALAALGCLGGVFFFWKSTEEEDWRLQVISAGFLCTAILIKPTSLHVGVPLAYLCHRKYGGEFLRKPALWLYALAVLVPALLWFRHADHLWRIYGNSFYVAYLKLGMPHAADRVWLRLARHLTERVVLEISAIVGLPLLIMGAARQRFTNNKVLYWWAIGFGISIFLWPRGNNGHDYYQLPITFVTCTWMALGAVVIVERVSSCSTKRAILLLACAGVMLCSTWRLAGMFQLDEIGRIEFDRHVKQVSAPGNLIIFVRPDIVFVPREFLQHRDPDGEYFGCDPVDFYLSERKGWSLQAYQATPAMIEKLRHKGAHYFATYYPEILDSRPELVTALHQKYTKAETNSRWVIYQLNEPAPQSAAPPVFNTAGEDVSIKTEPAQALP